MSIPSWLENILKIVPLVLEVIPGVPQALVAPIAQAVADAEVAFGSGTGAQKLAAVQDAASQAISINNAVNKTQLDETTILPLVSTGIGLAVTLANGLNQFVVPPVAPPAA